MIILTILGVIGKILLLILLILVALILLILFFPVQYRASGKFNGGTRMFADVWWLFAVVFLRVSYDTAEGQLRIVLRIFGIPIPLYPKRPRKARGIRRKALPEEQSGVKVSGEERKEPPLPAGNSEKEQQKEAPKKKTIGDRVRSVFQKIRDFFTSIPEKLKRIHEKAASTGEKLARVREELLDPGNKDAIRHILAEGKTLFSHIRPRRLRMKLRFSTGDPATTGEVVGAVSVLPFAYQKGNQLVPDFVSEEAYLNGTIGLSGHIVIFYAVAMLVRLLLDKKVRRLIRHIKAMKG